MRDIERQRETERDRERETGGDRYMEGDRREIGRDTWMEKEIGERETKGERGRWRDRI